MGTVRYCENCQKALHPGARLCENCGALVPPEHLQRRAGGRQVPLQRQVGRQQIPPQNTRRNMPPRQMLYQEQERRRRYRQEGLQKEWRQSWEREYAKEDRSGIAPIQYVLIGFAAALMIAILVLGASWIIGRNANMTVGNRNDVQTVQTGTKETESEAVIVILDGGTAEKHAEIGQE